MIENFTGFQNMKLVLKTCIIVMTINLKYRRKLFFGRIYILIPVGNEPLQSFIMGKILITKRQRSTQFSSFYRVVSGPPISTKFSGFKIDFLSSLKTDTALFQFIFIDGYDDVNLY